MTKNTQLKKIIYFWRNKNVEESWGEALSSGAELELARLKESVADNAYDVGEEVEVAEYKLHRMGTLKLKHSFALQWKKSDKKKGQRNGKSRKNAA